MQRQHDDSVARAGHMHGSRHDMFTNETHAADFCMRTLVSAPSASLKQQLYPSINAPGYVVTTHACMHPRIQAVDIPVGGYDSRPYVKCGVCMSALSSHMHGILNMDKSEAQAAHIS